MIFKATSRIARWGRLLFLPRFGCSRCHLPDRKIAIFPLLFLCLTGFSRVGYANSIELQSDTSLATAGYYQLSWSQSDANNQLQESTDADFSSFKVIYQGADTASQISGKSDGDYFYRVIDVLQGKQSNVVEVEVKHHSLQKAIFFFLAGAIVFIAILVLVFAGRRQQDS